MFYILASSLLSVVTVSVLSRRRKAFKRATVQSEQDDPALFI